MSTVPGVAIAPPPRCFSRGIDRCGPVCGELASHMRRGRDWFNTEYFCGQHAAPGDEPIPPEHIFRRVRVFCDVYFAGVAVSAPVSHTEAVARLEAAVRAAGGAIEVHEVRSHVVQSAPQTGPGLALTGRFDPE